MGLALSIVAALAADFPWTTLQNHTHWAHVLWLPFLSPPVRIVDSVLNVLLFVPAGGVRTARRDCGGDVREGGRDRAACCVRRGDDPVVQPRTVSLRDRSGVQPDRSGGGCGPDDRRDIPHSPPDRPERRTLTAERRPPSATERPAPNADAERRAPSPERRAPNPTLRPSRRSRESLLPGRGPSGAAAAARAGGGPARACPAGTSGSPPCSRASSGSCGTACSRACGIPNRRSSDR